MSDMRQLVGCGNIRAVLADDGCDADYRWDENLYPQSVILVHGLMIVQNRRVNMRK